MKRTNLILISTLFASSFFINTAHADVIDRATILSNTCAGCHGPNGISHGPLTPSIAGLSKEYILESMHDFASGKRPSTVMQRIAKGYSDADIKAVAEYFSKLPSKAVVVNPAHDHKH